VVTDDGGIRCPEHRRTPDTTRNFAAIRFRITAVIG
jgi:hypothetical protein